MSGRLDKCDKFLAKHGNVRISDGLLALLGAVCIFLSVTWAFETIRYWFTGLEDSRHNVDGLIVVVFVCAMGMFMAALFRDRMINQPNNKPIRGNTLVLVLIWICGISGVVSTIGETLDWLGLTGGSA